MKRSVHNPSMKDMSKSQAEPPTFAMLRDANDAFVEHAPPLDPKLKDDENSAKAWRITSPRDFDDMSQEWSRLFDGKENEQNWDKRRKAIIKLSRITHGNAPVDYRIQYTSFIKSQLDAILKVVDSLRTNVSAAGLNLLQHIAQTLGHGVDFMVDFVAETLIARCCNTSKVKRDPAIFTFETIISNATCNKNILHYIVSASEHKDPNARTAVANWLIALLTRDGHCDQPGVLDLVEKCIKNGLNDAKPQVRTPMRSTYGTYANFWPERAERLRNSLDTKTQKLLESSNPQEPSKASMKRPSIKDLKAAKTKEMDAREMARPASAQSQRPSIREIKKAKMREMEARSAHHLPTASSDRSLVRDGKILKQRNMEAEDAIRPSSAQSHRGSTRDHKTMRKRDPDGDDVVGPSSTQSHSRHKSRDLESHDPTRPVSAHLHTKSMDRRFHILSSAPMRPQRSFVEVKRVAPKLARSVQQQPTHSEIPNPPFLEELKPSRHVERKLNGPKSESIAIAQVDLPQLEPLIAKTSKSKHGDSEMQADRHSPSAWPGKETEVVAVASTRELPQVEVRQILDEGDKRIEQASEIFQRGPSPTKQERMYIEKAIEIHEDEASAEQNGPTKTHRPASKRSPGKDIGSEDGNKVPERISPTPQSPPTVLREIDQLNRTLEPARRQENSRQKYISTEVAARNRSVSPTSQNPEKARKQLSRAVEKVRMRSMDDYGYRRLQGLIRHHDTLFQDEERYEELLLALLEILETPNTEKRVPLGRQFDNKFQILVTIRLMLVHNAKYFTTYHARALCALITARRNFESRCHIVGGLEETADDVVSSCQPDAVLDAVLDTLELQEDDAAGCRAMSLGLHILCGLVARISGDEIKDKVQEERLTGFASKCLRNENSETRRATIAFGVELRRLIEPEEKYFQLIAGKDEALKSLLTYFIASSRRR